MRERHVQVVWHPFEDGLLAFSVLSGRIGVFNVYAQKLIPFKSYHRDKVYALSWLCLKKQDEPRGAVSSVTIPPVVEEVNENIHDEDTQCDDVAAHDTDADDDGAESSGEPILPLTRSSWIVLILLCRSS